MKRESRSELAANVSADAEAALLDGGTLRIYGEPYVPIEIPAGKELAILGFSAKAFTPAEGGVVVANAISPEESAPRTGVATWYRTYTVDGEPVYDGTVGESDANMNLDTVKIQVKARVSVSRFVRVHPLSDN